MVMIEGYGTTWEMGQWSLRQSPVFVVNQSHGDGFSAPLIRNG